MHKVFCHYGILPTASGFQGPNIIRRVFFTDGICQQVLLAWQRTPRCCQQEWRWGTWCAHCPGSCQTPAVAAALAAWLISPCAQYQTIFLPTARRQRASLRRQPRPPAQLRKRSPSRTCTLAASAAARGRWSSGSLGRQNRRLDGRALQGGRLLALGQMFLAPSHLPGGLVSQVDLVDLMPTRQSSTGRKQQMEHSRLVAG